MARWNRSGRYYGRNRRGYGYIRTRNYYKTTRAKSYGNMRAAKQQADQSTVTINIPSTIEAANYTSLDIDGNSTVNFGVYPLNIFEQLRKSEFYKSYASMYDEFKIDKVKVKLLPTEFTYTVTEGAGANPGKYRNVTVYTAWDRTGLSKDQVRILATHVNANSERIGVVTREVNDQNEPIVNDDGDGLYCVVGNDITTYSSAESRVVNPGTNTSIVRWLNPKTMEEKGQWISTGLLKQWYEGYYASKFYGLPTARALNHIKSSNGDVEIGDMIFLNEDTQQNPTTQAVYLNRLSAANAQNPCYLIEDNAIRFKPTLLVGVYPESSAANQNNCKFNVETEVVITFRGLRKASVVSALYNGGDNPPGYDYDIINNQLIDTFGVTSAPENFVFGSVNVQPRANYHTEHTFNTNDLTQEQIENAAIQDSDGTVHQLGINQPQNHEQGAIINESALTILKWGKYNLDSVGLHQIAVEPNTNNWVIPAVMNVQINLAANQVLRNNGIYNVVQGQNGLEFQQAQQQQARGLPDPTGTLIGQFNVTVPNSKIVLKGFKQSYSSSTITEFKDFIRKTTEENITLPTGKTIVTITAYAGGDYKFLLKANNTGSNITQSLSSSSPIYYKIIDNVFTSCYVVDDNNYRVFCIYDFGTSDDISGTVEIWNNFTVKFS